MKRPGWGILILILLGGGLLNVASGWVCERLEDSPWWAWSTNAPSQTSTAEVAWLGRHAQANWPKPTGAMRRSEFGIQVVDIFHHESSDTHWVHRYRNGWPFVSMESVQWHDVQLRTTRLDARLGGRNSWMALNLRPLWPGTIVNTLFYALILLGAYYLHLWTRRRRRIRHGKCPECAYDLRGGGHAGCPECGAALGAVRV